MHTHKHTHTHTPSHTRAHTCSRIHLVTRIIPRAHVVRQPQRQPEQRAFILLPPLKPKPAETRQRPSTSHQLRPRHINRDAAAGVGQQRLRRVEDAQAVTRHKGRHVGVVVADVEAYAELAGFERVGGFAALVDEPDVLEIPVRENRIVVDEKRRPLQPSDAAEL
jgi:hypothetical protein